MPSETPLPPQHAACATSCEGVSLVVSTRYRTLPALVRSVIPTFISTVGPRNKMAYLLGPSNDLQTLLRTDWHKIPSIPCNPSARHPCVIWYDRRLASSTYVPVTGTGTGRRLRKRSFSLLSVEKRIKRDSYLAFPFNRSPYLSMFVRL
jgi:hypothetical protein